MSDFSSMTMQKGESPEFPTGEDDEEQNTYDEDEFRETAYVQNDSPIKSKQKWGISKEQMKLLDK